MMTNRQRVDGIQIASPCNMNWAQMQGDDRVRFCSACRLHVYNLSAMDVEEAAQLISDNSSGLCVRLYRRKDGTVITRDCPKGRRIAVRRKRAGYFGLVTGAAILLATAPTLHPARTPNAPAARRTIRVFARPPQPGGTLPAAPISTPVVRMGRRVAPANHR